MRKVPIRPGPFHSPLHICISSTLSRPRNSYNESYFHGNRIHTNIRIHRRISYESCSRRYRNQSNFHQRTISHESGYHVHRIRTNIHIRWKNPHVSDFHWHRIRSNVHIRWNPSHGSYCPFHHSQSNIRIRRSILNASVCLCHRR